MSISQGILLGLLQGVAEFLPISSSGHLSVVQHIMGLSDVPVLFDIVLHLATLAAVILFFRKKVWALLCAFGRLITRKTYSNPQFSAEENLLAEKNNRMYILAIVIATAVTGVIGVIVKKLDLDELPVKFVCAGFIVTSVLLISSSIVEKIRNKKVKMEHIDSSENISVVPVEMKSPNWWQAIVIGFAQGCGTLAGISRSGSTISGSLYCGVNRAQAGEFSFIVSIPAILGAFILELKDLGEMNEAVGILPLVFGCLAAFISGYAALSWLMKLIKKGKLEWFAAYLIPAGILGMIFLH